MRSKVYLETTVISYLTAAPSRDIVQAAHQQITREWWERRKDFDLFVSQAVITEVGRGDSDAAARRLAAVEGIAVLGDHGGRQQAGRGVHRAARASGESGPGCAPHRCRRGDGHRLRANVELHAHRQRCNQVQNRGCLPQARVRTTGDLHAGRIDGVTMARDEIVEETRRVRDEFAKSHDYDVKKISRALKREEAAGGRKLVRLSPRRSSGRAPKRKTG